MDKSNTNNNQNVFSDFVAIDVETAQGARWSICQIGIAIVEGGEIKECVSYYVQPPDNKYLQGNINVHHITPEMTINKPFFPEIWSKIRPMIENRLVVAHNAAFDIDCLVKTLNYYNLDIPTLETECTYVRTGGKLKDVCAAYGIETSNHHDAKFDALACARVYINLMNGYDPPCSSEFSVKTKVEKKRAFGFAGHGSPQSRFLKPDLENAEHDNYFYNKKVLFTGILERFTRDEAAEIVYKLGANVDTGVTKRTNIVIVGKDAGPSKLKKIEEYNKNGAEIRVLYESEFLIAIKKHI